MRAQTNTEILQHSTHSADITLVADVVAGVRRT
jgi:hypothetical protein